jgi:hypothetical protein
MITKFLDFIRSRAFESEGDYIGGNDWTMDHDWANYKDHYNDRGSIDFDVDAPEEEALINAEDQDDVEREVSHSDLLSMIEDLISRVKKLEKE